ncbi:hypothetical protein E0Z10_g7516 [Xylaria hypoxylon]|uniref:SET domain-containing protein n=1 Tax=Xylaria hypoxylon TaxID=37992 RepID=A0A4Z0YXY0_9PEZI|nr:hypothetical protein E0Z10_g7516 [Xylaria hypoxylon]
MCAAPNTFAYLSHCPLETENYELSNNYASNNSSQQAERWHVDRTCYRAGPDEYCTYTNALFNNGEGVSFIATAESISHITNRSAFRSEVSVPKIDGPYREAKILGKGQGLVVTKAVRTGQTLISRTPALVVGANTVKTLKRDELDDLLVRAVDNLPSMHRDDILELSTHDGARTHREKVGKIFRTNSFSTGSHDGNSNFQSLFATVSRINHSCRPNCAYFFDSNTFSQNVVAVRDIQLGEELSVAYIDPILPRSERLKRLKAWGFECLCERCSANATQTAESDENVAEILRLWKELDNYSASSHATPAMAERLISLYNEEGLQSRVQEAHYRAAVEWIGIGEIEKASEHAALCVKYGTLFKGPGRPFIEKMNQLLDNPTSHPHWMFRSKHVDV